MPRYRRFFQLDPRSFRPFNEAPNYLHGSVLSDDSDRLKIVGTADYYLHNWDNMGARSPLLKPHSFAFSVNALPRKALGAYSIGVIGTANSATAAKLPRINVSHFLKSSTSLLYENVKANFYSGFAFDNHGQRTQVGIRAP